ncbi:glycosyltransferase family 4 protein [Calidifontibacter indicus]|uniref:glycosyltransferase family 4 protein n=1 Tax=Calidifontibacter indicus TaxID=419650 RepID=UPI003D72F8DC
MKVAVAFHGCHRRGGVERVMYECVNYLAERGHDVDAFAGEWDESVLQPGVRKHALTYLSKPPALVMPAYRFDLDRALSELTPKPDVVASFGATAPPDSVTWMQSVHATWIETARETRDLRGRLRQRVNPFHPVALRMERALLHERRYRRVIALTPEVKADIMRHYGVPDADIDVIPNGYSAREFFVPSEEARAEVRRELGVGDDERLVIFVANELERKGFRQLAHAIASLADPSVRLLAVGGFSVAEAKAIIREAGLHERQALLAGRTSDIHRYYAASDFFALPTKYEAWGLVVVEAMASGLPVLTSVTAGAAVAVRDGDNGVLVGDPTSIDDVSAGLRRLLELQADPEGIARSVARFEWSNVLRSYESTLAHAARG